MVAADAANSNPYTGIVDRNVFSLKPQQVVDSTPAAPPAPPVKLTLTGITTILGNKRALLKAQIPAKAPAPAKDESYMLTEGQSADGIQVLTIDERSGKVTVNNNGLPETLDFVNHGAKLLAAAAAPGTPGVIPAPGGIPLPNAAGAANPLSRTLPTRNMRGGAQDSASGEQGNAGVSAGNASMASAATMHFQGDITPEQQTMMIEGQRLHLQDQGKLDEAAMFPNTEVTEILQQEAEPSPVLVP